MQIQIYSLSCPISNQVRYIGITKVTLKRRLALHVYDSLFNPNNKKTSHKVNWIKFLDKKGLKPIIETVEILQFYDWEAEKYWIAQFKQWGFNLVNSTEGGEHPITKSGKQNPNFGNKYREDLKTTKGRVVQLDFQGNHIRTYKCAAQVELFGFKTSTVSMCLLGKRNQHRGFQFLREKDYDPNKDNIFKRKSTQAHPVVQLTMSGEYVATYPRMSAAPYSSRCISRVCLGQRNSTYGYKWVYLEDYEKRIKI